MKSKNMVYEVDKQSYIQKNRIMVRWSELFGIEWGDKTADDVRFADLLKAVKNQDSELVYQELYKIVKHGVSAEQKTFLYQYSKIMFEDDAEYDFGSLIDNMRDRFKDAHGSGTVVIHTKIEQDPDYRGYYCLDMTSDLDKVEFYFKAEELPFEAMLVQNGQILIINAVSAFEKVPELQKAIAQEER